MLRSFIILFISFVLITSSKAAWSISSKELQSTLPMGAEFWVVDAEDGERSARIHCVFFSNNAFQFQVVDNPTSLRTTLRDAMQAIGATAGINGGYFHGDFTPVGLVIAEGKSIHPFERAKLLSGVFAVTDSGANLIRSTAFKPASITQALQAGPFLIDEGKPVVGLNAERLAKRTALATDGKDTWMLLSFSPVTLNDAASLLAGLELKKAQKIQTALNFDGGSSTALWVATIPSAFYLPESGPVRNFLAIIPRTK